MLAAFLRHGLTQEEAETESLFQVYVAPLAPALTRTNQMPVSLAETRQQLL